MSSTRKMRVAVVGASGYGGAELARLLAAHPRAALQVATASGERAGAKLSDLFPSLRGVCDVRCQEFDAQEIGQSCDFAFIALGHGKAMDLAPQLLERGLKVCDLGADFRLRDPAVFEAWYKTPHVAPRVLGEAVYGLPEWNREKIKAARLVANPGCYPTSAILALGPFVAARLVEPQSLIVDSASGTSGAGRSSFGVELHHPEASGNFKAYKVGSHRHTPEIEQGLSDAAQSPTAQSAADDAGALDVSTSLRVTFTPHLLPVARGILSTCYATLRGPLTTDEAHRALAERYADEPFVRVHLVGEMPQIKHVAGSNFCDLGVAVDERAARLIVVAAEDNLVKGAAGQAIQNMNLMCGFPESDGLHSAPLFP